MFFRAPSLASGATASSRSRKTWSAGSDWALSSIFGELPGTARQERRGRSSGATAPPNTPGKILDRSQRGSPNAVRSVTARLLDRYGPGAGAHHHRDAGEQQDQAG